MGQFDNLISQIEKFISKYYKNEMVKGGILFLSVLLVTYGLVTTLEYFGRFGSTTRLSLLIAFVGINLVLLFRFLLIPVLKLNKVGRHLSLKQASLMIGSIFPEVGDKVLNTLHLYENKEDTSLNIELVQASIEQKSAQLSVVPFSTAIDLSENKKYLRFLLPIFFGILLIGFLNPNIFTDGSERIVNFDKEYVEPAPFEFILNSDESIKEGEDYTLRVKLKGEELPDEVKIYSNLGNYNLVKKSNVLFEYTFNNLSEDLVFHCEANGFESDKFRVESLAKPILEELTIDAIYPKHTGKKSESFQNSGDITVPEGTMLKWRVSARNLESLDVLFKDTSFTLNGSIANGYAFQKKFFDSESYDLVLSSQEVKAADSLSYAVNIVKDKYPTISVEEIIDSTNEMKRFVEGKISDDYGFRSLAVKLSVVGKDTSYSVVKPLKFNSKSTTQLFSYYVDLSLFKLKPGERIEYSFTVTDNDEINGFKSSSTGKKVYNVPEMDELDNALSDKNQELKNEMSDALKQSLELKQKIKNMKSDLLNKESTDWKDRQSLQNLLDLQKDLEKKVDKLKTDFDKNKNENENFFEPDEEFLEKQEMLQKLMEELMDDEMKELFKELEELMEELNKNKLLENLEEMEMESENMEEKMDRTLELFKNMELDQKLENLEEQLEDLRQQQEKLEEQTKNEEMSSEELSKKQEELNEKFDEIKKDIEEIKEKNEELENPRDLDFDQEMEDAIEQEMDDAKENLDNQKNSKAQKNQQKASEMMKQMKDDVSSMQMQASQQQQAEDMDALRYLLENVVALSHDQEDLMDEYRVTQTSDPYYLQLNRDQLAIDKATDIVRDSLTALSKRVHQLSTYITDELSELNYNLDKSLKLSEDRETNRLLQYQQYAMTDYNDLALMLSEVLDQMQQQMQQQMNMPGSGSCDKPGGMGMGKGSKSQMNMQQMKDAMKEQIGKMKGGKNPGGKEGQSKDGEGMGQGMGGSIPGLSTKEQVKMAAQQAQIREALKQLKEELNKDGSGFGNTLNDMIKDIDKLEDDLLNGNVGSDYVKRQEDILTRLLESEKAMRERGYSEERESNEGKNLEEGNQIKFTEYNRKKNAEVEFMRSLPLGLQVYYKTLVNEYFNSVNN
ncbi:hypothetical protein K6119_12480 [Paracrocinitomix mangrovi]|uniref:DUF4175 family protein n=1 Tax=Paracrocinitomix mangrovi TaxID=2862509 RepID=UPI001C8DBBAD|nr:DUF4175 family protein [Paracrocinitomix mangrovi]UKN00549.1 hypothetical protein K6119_12480 [Paracrocinitomix mangrovi]